jgi:hypothetical protein
MNVLQTRLLFFLSFLPLYIYIYRVMSMQSCVYPIYVVLSMILVLLVPGSSGVMVGGVSLLQLVGESPKTYLEIHRSFSIQQQNQQVEKVQRKGGTTSFFIQLSKSDRCNSIPISSRRMYFYELYAFPVLRRESIKNLLLKFSHVCYG